MANILTLNTAQNAGINQFVQNTQGGLLDFLAQKSGSTVTVTGSAADQIKKNEVLATRGPVAGPVVIES